MRKKERILWQKRGIKFPPPLSSLLVLKGWWMWGSDFYNYFLLYVDISIVRYPSEDLTWYAMSWGHYGWKFWRQYKSLMDCSNEMGKPSSFPGDAGWKLQICITLIWTCYNLESINLAGRLRMQGPKNNKNSKLLMSLRRGETKWWLIWCYSY
jgi:hypothetical protein